jgi:acetyl-CoA carboxylase biotin carboxyl carrier protein
MTTDDAGKFVTDDLPRILDTLRGSDIRELELTEGDVRLRLRRAAPLEDGQVVEAAIEEVEVFDLEPSEVHVTAPLVGTFYSAANPGDPPFVGEGSAVDEHTVVGIIEALQVLTEVEAGYRGSISAVLATDGQAVEYGQALFQVVPNG